VRWWGRNPYGSSGPPISEPGSEKRLKRYKGEIDENKSGFVD
jgi:hypothetical protein